MLLLKGHTGTVRALAFSPDGSTLASAGDDQTVCLWDCASASLLRTFRGHADAVRALTFHPRSGLLYSGSWDGTVRLWNPQTGRGRGVLSHVGCIWGLAFSPDGHELAGVAGNDAWIWNLSEKKPRVKLEGHRWPVVGLAYFLGGKYLATASQDHTVMVWDAHWGRLASCLAHHDDWVLCVAAADDGRTLASGSGDGVIVLTGSSLKRLARLSGHAGAVVHLAFLPGGGRLLSAGWDGTLRLWDLGTVEQRRALDLGLGRVHRVAVAPHGMTAAVAGEDNDVLLLDLDFGDG